MPIVLRNSKNSALTHSELDGNFTDLDTRVNSKADSSTITGIVDQDYIRNRQITYLDSVDITSRITSLIDSNYIQTRQNTYDNADVNTHLNLGNAAPNQILSWTGADFDWINQTSGTGGGIDSAVVINIVDSAYIQARQQTAVTYTNSDVDTHLNTSTASANEILSWTGTDYDWVAQSGGGSGLDSAGVASYLNGGWNFHLIPDTNSTYDIGSAEYKVRHLYLSDNSLYFDSGQTSIGFETIGTSKNLKFNNNVVKEASHTEEAGGPVDISKTNHFVTTGATYDLPMESM